MIFSKRHVYLTILTIIVYLNIVAGGPIDLKQNVPSPAAFKFMRQFGYLEKGPSDAEALYREEAVIEAIKNVQKFGAIPETGIVDKDTMELMASPRCGVPDISRPERSRQKRFIIGALGWNKRKLTYYIANWSPNIGEQGIAADMKKAFDSWAGYGNLSFQRVYDNNADIIIAFGSSYHGDAYPFDGPGRILAHAYYPLEMGHYGGDIHFDNDENWVSNPENNNNYGEVDFFTVAVHELGHSLGLAHSPVTSSVMFPYYKGTKSGFQLDYDDILAMYELYIQRRLPEDNVSFGNNASSEEDYATSSSVTSTTTEKPTTRRQYTTPRPRSTTNYPSVTYMGDDETVDEHKKHDETHGLEPSRPQTPVDICDGNYDAVAFLRQELFVFKDQYVWRLRELGIIEQDYPVLFRDLFWKLPKSVIKIDAAYERPTDGAIILFTGNQYWVYNGYDFIDSPRPITDYGLPTNLDKIDAAQVWKKNGKIYLYRGNQMWRFNETTKQMDEKYPLPITRWRGIPDNLDAAVTWKDGLTYFFKGLFVWKFDNHYIRVDKDYPQLSTHQWFGCPLRSDTQYNILKQ